MSTKLKNTVTVLVERVAINPLYKKTFIRSKKLLVDDSIGVKEGDVVEIINCKPVSGNKHWKVTKVLGKSLAEMTKEKLKVEAEAAISEVMPEKEEEQLESSDTNQKLNKEGKKGGSKEVKSQKLKVKSASKK